MLGVLRARVGREQLVELHCFLVFRDAGPA